MNFVRVWKEKTRFLQDSKELETGQKQVDFILIIIGIYGNFYNFLGMYRFLNRDWTWSDLCALEMFCSHYLWDRENPHERKVDRSLWSDPGVSITESLHCLLYVTSLQNCCLKSLSWDDMERKNIITYNLNTFLFSLLCMDSFLLYLASQFQK